MSIDVETKAKHLEITYKQQKDLQAKYDSMMSKLNLIDGQAQGALKMKDEDMDAYRSKVIELQTEMSTKDNQIADLETKVIELSTEV